MATDQIIFSVRTKFGTDVVTIPFLCEENRFAVVTDTWGNRWSANEQRQPSFVISVWFSKKA